VKELQIPLPPQEIQLLWHYVGENAGTFEDVRIAAAAFEAIEKDLPVRKPLSLMMQKITQSQNPDGTYGKEGNVARETGGAVAAILRLGGEPANRANVIKAIKSGQRPDGGWGKAGEPSDLETCYRVMRAFKMLGEQPNKEAIRVFIAKCRNADGSYGVQPGQPGSVSGTYYAGIILSWLEAMR
jgi:hypothetical protein